MCDGLGPCRFDQLQHRRQDEGTNEAASVSKALESMPLARMTTDEFGREGSKIMSVIPKIFITDAAARLRALRTDKERISE